jgi:hypothetical protein
MVIIRGGRFMASERSAIPLEMLDDNLTALIEAGDYDSERQLVRDALEALVEANPELRLEMAITLWRQSKITLARPKVIAKVLRMNLKRVD